MNREEGDLLEKKTLDRINNYNTQIKKKIILTETELVQKYQYKTTPLAGIRTPEFYGFTDRFFGGNVDKCAIIKDSPYILLVDKYYNTLALLLPEENIEKLTVKECQFLCKKYALTYSTEMKKSELIDIIKKSL